jgi:hypothetical protein
VVSYLALAPEPGPGGAGQTDIGHERAEAEYAEICIARRMRPRLHRNDCPRPSVLSLFDSGLTDARRFAIGVGRYRRRVLRSYPDLAFSLHFYAW